MGRLAQAFSLSDRVSKKAIGVKSGFPALVTFLVILS